MQDEAKTLKEEAQERLAKHARRSESDGKIGGMLNLARAWVGVSPDELDADPWLFNCLNGTLDLRTGELLSHQQGSLITKLAPFEYQPEATCPTWEAFLRQIFADCQPLIDYMQRAVGYAMTGVIREQCLFFLHGRGANGKSTFLSVIQDVLGDYARDTPTESLMIKQNEGISNDIARLKGARFVTAVETEAEKRMAESLVKRLTGGDTITARFMRQEYFQFRGTFKIFLAANHKPGVRGTDDGIWRRIKHIPFEVQIPDAEQDAELPDKLKQEAEGILAWAVRGCMAWQRQGLGEPTEVTQATAAYRDEMDWLGPFIEERCILQATQSVGAKNLYKAYLEYCESINEKSLSLSRFGRLISDRPRIVKRRSGPGGGWEYWGIGLSDSSDADIADDGENGDLGAKCSVDADGSRSKLNTLDTTEHFPLLSVSLKETHAGVIGSSVQKCSGVQLNAETHLDYDPETEMEI
jgi:putative DNA primase/helicase